MAMIWKPSTILKVKVGYLALLTSGRAWIHRSLRCSLIQANNGPLTFMYKTEHCYSKRISLRECILRCHSSYQGNFIAKFSEEIDLEALRDKKIQGLKRDGTNFHVNDIVKEILAKKCDEAISNLTPEDQKRLKVIKLEHDFLFSEGYAIPTQEEMTSENWLEALNHKSKLQRLRYYKACQKKRFVKENAKNKKKAHQELGLQEREQETNEIKVINDNKIILRVYDSTMKRFLNHRLSAAMRFGIPLVLDMDYADYMTNRDVKNTTTQVQDVYCLNRLDTDMPFHLHLTGCPNSNPMYRMLQIIFQDDPHFMATVTPQSYLDIFDRSELVYLSPHAKQVLKEFDPNAVYIIGAYNDKTTQKPVSYARAKEHKIKCKRLPLDEHLNWSTGSKSLTLNQMMSIMTAIKNKKSWLEAFEAVPTRKYLKNKGYER